MRRHTFLSFLFASPDRALLMWMWLRTSLAASGPWDTKADRRLRHWRTNLSTTGEKTHNIRATGRRHISNKRWHLKSSHQPVVFWMDRSLQELHVVGNCLFHNSTADHVEVGQVTGCPQEDHLQALKHQHHLHTNKVWSETYPKGSTSTEKMFLQLTSLSTCFSLSSSLNISAHSMEILMYPSTTSYRPEHGSFLEVEMKVSRPAADKRRTINHSKAKRTHWHHLYEMCCTHTDPSWPCRAPSACF